VFEDNMVEAKAKARGLRGQGQRSSRPEVFEVEAKARSYWIKAMYTYTILHD